MSSLNKVILIGNVGKEPEVHVVNSDRKVAKFSLATSEKWKDSKGEIQEETTWHNIVMWGKQADVVEKYVKKGDKLCVEGKIKNRKYTANDGTEKYITEVVVDNMTMLGSPGGAKQSSAGGASESKSSYDDLDI